MKNFIEKNKIIIIVVVIIIIMLIAYNYYNKKRSELKNYLQTGLEKLAKSANVQNIDELAKVDLSTLKNVQGVEQWHYDVITRAKERNVTITQQIDDEVKFQMRVSKNLILKMFSYLA